MSRRSTGRRPRLPLGAAALALVALCATAALALAAHPVNGGRYKGQIENSPVNTKISFKVNRSGTKVHHLKTKLDPIFNNDVCGGVTPSVTQESNPARISRRGKFRGVIHYTYPESGDAHGKAIVKGKFHRHGKEDGKVIARFENPDCNGSAPYSTKAR
jgi:hypothetical protein